jgi:hypothetical protein
MALGMTDPTGVLAPATLPAPTTAGDHVYTLVDDRSRYPVTVVITVQ